jgi:DNA-binding CsgD family transcriptional regulator
MFIVEYQSNFPTRAQSFPSTREEKMLNTPTAIGENSSTLNMSPFWLDQLLNQVGFGILILDKHFKLYFCNSAARQSLIHAGLEGLIADGTDGMSRSKSVPNSSKEQFWAFVHQVEHGQRKFAFLGHGEQQITAALSSIAIGDNHTEPGLLITIERKNFCEGSSLWAYGRILGLTAGELKVLDYLAQGQDPKIVATSLKISVSTVRTHIRSIFGKTASTNMRDLMMKIAKLPPVTTGSAFKLAQQ